jgi:N-acetylmuramoyl-L-alanine amidase
VTDVNGRSIGVEVVNPGQRWGLRPYPPAQMTAVADLLRDVATRWPIRPDRVLCHSDVAPYRKEDPGEYFDWEALAAAGIGLMPPDDLAIPACDSVCLGDGGAAAAALQTDLGRLGYNIQPSGVFDPATLCVVRAFQRHWRRRDVGGTFDAECRARLDWLLGAVAAH